MNAILEALALALFIAIMLFSCGCITAGIWMITRSAIKSIKTKHDA